jgi:hypothetical protein
VDPFSINHNQGYLCDGTCQNAVLELLSHKDASQNGIPEPLFPGIGITNTTLSDQILGHSLHSKTFCKRKIALLTTKVNSTYMPAIFLY